MISIKLSRNAANYVRNETEYLRQRNPVAARGFRDLMRNAQRMLQSFPEAGNRVHRLQITGYRTLVTGNYLLDYTYDGSRIEIVLIRSGRMQIPMPDVDEDGEL